MEDLERFVAVVDAGSISEAARVLAMPRATVSRQVSRLEEHLGVRLLHRSTRRLALTEAGAELYQRGRRILAEVREATEAVRFLDGTPRGTLRVTTMPGSGAALGRIVSRYLREHPAVDVELVESGEHVDLVGNGFDLGLRAGAIHDSNLIARRLGETRVLACASPSYFAGRDVPESIEDLAHHECVRGYTADGRPRTHWPRLDGGRFAVSGRLCTNSPTLLRTAVEEGLGIGLFPHISVQVDIAQGSLVPVLEHVVGQAAGVHLVYPEREFLPPKVRAFIDLTVDEFGGDLGKLGQARR